MNEVAKRQALTMLNGQILDVVAAASCTEQENPANADEATNATGLSTEPEVLTNPTRNDNTNNSSNKSSHYYTTIASRSSNILLIGLSYNCRVRDQYLGDSNINSITQCKDSNGRVIDQCVAQHTFRC